VTLLGAGEAPPIEYEELHNTMNDVVRNYI
jgi:hypothetical protein